MFTAQDMIAALILGLFAGAVAGAIAWDVLVAQPARRHRQQLRDRVIEWQLREYTARARLAAHVSLRDATDHDRWSRKVTPVRVVPDVAVTEHPSFVMGDPNGAA